MSGEQDAGRLSAEDEIISLLCLNAEPPPIPSEREFKDNYVKRLKSTPTTLEKCGPDRHPLKGRIMRAKCDIKEGEGILVEYPLVKISEFSRIDKIESPEVSLASYDDAEVDPKTTDKVITYNPYNRSNVFVDLYTIKYENDIAEYQNVQSDFVTLTRHFQELPQDVKNGLKELFSIDPRRYKCPHCTINFNDYADCTNSALPPEVKGSLCKLCLLLHNMLIQEVIPMLRMFPSLGIRTTDRTKLANRDKLEYYVPQKMQQFYCTTELVDDIIRACLAFDFNCFETGSNSISVFKYMCMCSHSCAPNAVWEYSPLIRRMKLTASRFIAAGDEITVSYLCDDDICSPREFRRVGLESSHMFRCCCVRCLAEDPKIRPLVMAYIDKGDEGVKELGPQEEGVQLLFDKFKGELGKSPAERQVIRAVAEHSNNLVGLSTTCPHCNHEFYDAFAPCSWSGAGKTKRLGMPCPECNKMIYDDIYTRNQDGQSHEYLLRRNNLYGMWVAILEKPKLLKSVDHTYPISAILSRLIQLVETAVDRRCGFLASEFTCLLAIALFNYSVLKKDIPSQAARSAMLIGSVVKCYRTTLFGPWIDLYMGNYQYSYLREEAKVLGFKKLYNIVNRLIWACAVRCGIESDGEYKLCSGDLDTILDDLLQAQHVKYGQDESTEEKARKCQFPVSVLSPVLPFSERITPVSSISSSMKPEQWLNPDSKM